MAWNEPGGDNRDPWSGKGGEKGPPDLDEVVRKLQDKMGGLFGGRRGGGDGGGGRSAGPMFKGGKTGVGLIVGIIFVVWLASGIYIIEPAERGVILRFGAFHKVTEPGPHWRIPFPVDEVVKVNVDEISSFRHKAQMLTRDENIVDVELTVQSRIQDPADYLFQDQLPDKTIQDANETALREVIGKSDLEFILTEGRSAVSAQVKTLIQELLNQYRTGLEVISVNMLPAKPPEQVKSAFDDAIKAREDNERMKNQALAYANEVVPKARGAAARQVEDAKAYKARVIAEAEGESQRFLALLAEYQKAPRVTRERLYLETVQDVLARTGKVMLDAKDSNTLTYLPLDRLMQQSRVLPSTSSLPDYSSPAGGDQMNLSEPGRRNADRSRRAR